MVGGFAGRELKEIFSGLRLIRKKIFVAIGIAMVIFCQSFMKNNSAGFC
jgi:hypothetical protein